MVWIRFARFAIVSVASMVVGSSGGARASSVAIPVAISLNDVVAVSSNNVWAVGNGTDSEDPDNTDPAFEHWDGARWRLVRSDRTLEDQEEIGGVAAAAPDDIWAVGSVGLPFHDDRQIEIQHWDGRAWSFVQPDQVSINNVLEGVTTVSSNDAWAVGSRERGGGSRDRSLIEHWDGNTWSLVVIPDPPDSDLLSSVAAISANDVWAVGSRVSSNGVRLQPLAMHWDGTRWSLVNVPAVRHRDSRFTDVVAIASDDVWAVGLAFEPTVPSVSRPITEHWDGTTWRLAPTPDTGQFHSDELSAVTAISSRDVWTVGNFVDEGEKLFRVHLKISIRVCLNRSAC